MSCFTRLSALALGTAVGFSPLLGQSPSAPKQVIDDTELLLDLLELMNTPVVGASKREQKLIDTPQAIEVLTGDEIRAMGIYKLSDALKHMTSVDILELDNLSTNVTLRGAMQQGQPRTVQILVDGVPLYNAVNASIDIDNLPVPVDIIDKVEVVRGPSSSLYGANAVVGVIAIKTRRPGEGLKAGARINRHNRQTWRGGADVTLGNEHWGVTGAYGGSSIGASNQPIPPSFETSSPTFLGNSSHQKQAMTRGEFKYGKGFLWASFAQGTKTADINKSTPNNYPRQAFLSQTLSTGWSHGWLDQLRSELRWSQLKHKDEIEIQQLIAANFPSMKDRLGQMHPWIDYTSELVEIQINWDPMKNLHFVAGGDYRKYESQPDVLSGRTFNSESASGGFLNVDYSFIEDLNLSVGARAENETIGGSRISPRAAITWSPAKNSSLRAGYYSSTRSPNIAESKMEFVNQFDPSPYGVPPGTIGLFYITPPPGIAPEKISSFEVGYRQVMGPVNLDLTVFEMKFTKLIAQKQIGAPVFSPAIPPYVPAFLKIYNNFTNTGDATSRGAELAVTYKMSNQISMGMNTTWMHFRTDETAGMPSQDFTYAPRFKANVWARFHMGKFAGYAAFQHVGKTDMEYLNMAGVASIRLPRQAINQLQCDFSYELIKGMQIRAFGRNILKDFTDYGAAGPTRCAQVQGARREWGGGLSYRF